MDTSVYSNTLPTLGKITDGYFLSGAENKHIPCLHKYIQFVRAFEKFLLLCWNNETNNRESDTEAFRLTHHNHEKRNRKGVVRRYQEFRHELNAYVGAKPGFHKNAWASYICLVLGNADLYTSDASPPPLFYYILSLLDSNPVDLFERFLSFDVSVEFADIALIAVNPILSGAYVDAFNRFLKKQNPPALWKSVLKFHRTTSGGEFMRFKAFEPVWDNARSSRLELKGIGRTQMQPTKPLYGIEENFRQLEKNLNYFIAGKPSRHVLLWGYRGTGKSSCVIKLADDYFDKGIRLVDYPVSNIDRIHHCFEKLGEYREKFILFLDDLSFEKTDVSYKLLKTNLEGSIKRRTANVLLHATTNRRELADPGQSVNDEQSGYPQLLDEKRAIDDRFGLKLFFDIPVFGDLKDLLLNVAAEFNCQTDPELLFKEFRRYCMSNRLTSPGGRAVRQFVNTMVAS